MRPDLCTQSWKTYESYVALYVAALKAAGKFYKEKPLHEDNSEYHSPIVAMRQREMEKAFTNFINEVVE